MSSQILDRDTWLGSSRLRWVVGPCLACFLVYAESSFAQFSLFGDLFEWSWRFTSLRLASLNNLRFSLPITVLLMSYRELCLLLVLEFVCNLVLLSPVPVLLLFNVGAQL